MKFICIAFFSVLVSSSFAQTKEEQEILNLVKKKFRWMIEEKLDSLRDLLDERLTYTHSSGWIQTRKDFIDDFTNGKLTYHSIELEDLKARIYPNTAIVNGRGKFTTTLNKTTKATFDLSFTEVYVSVSRKWKLVSRHANKMP